MSGEDQERFEDYLELERYIEELQSGQVAHPPQDMTPAQAQLYQTAALFRSLPSEAAEPRLEFAEQLKAHLQALYEQPDEPAIFVAPLPVPLEEQHEQPTLPTAPTMSSEQSAQQPLPVPKRPLIRHVSRRAMLTGGAVAAASLVVGAGADHLLAQVNAAQHGQPAAARLSTPTPAYDNMDIMPGIATTWQFVATLEQVSTSAVRFVTDSVVGYVVQTVDHYNMPQIIALSAACTHKGCIVQWQSSDRLFHCPCHSGLFDEGGSFVNLPGHTRYLSPLPRLNVKIEQNKVYVELPQNKP